MLFKSQSLAKILLAVSVVTASISGYYGNAWSEKLVHAKSSAQQAEQVLRVTERAFTELSADLVPDDKTLSLQEALSKVVLDVYNLRVDNGISVTSATPSAGGGSDAMEIGALAELVPNTASIQSIRISIRGAYTDYAGLLNYVKELQKNQLSVEFFEIRDLSFELSVRIFGESLAS